MFGFTNKKIQIKEAINNSLKYYLIKLTLMHLNLSSVTGEPLIH